MSLFIVKARNTVSVMTMCLLVDESHGDGWKAIGLVEKDIEATVKDTPIADFHFSVSDCTPSEQPIMIAVYETGAGNG